MSVYRMSDRDIQSIRNQLNRLLIDCEAYMEKYEPEIYTKFCATSVCKKKGTGPSFTECMGRWEKAKNLCKLLYGSGIYDRGPQQVKSKRPVRIRALKKGE